MVAGRHLTPTPTCSNRPTNCPHIHFAALSVVLCVATYVILHNPLESKTATKVNETITTVGISDISNSTRVLKIFCSVRSNNTLLVTEPKIQLEFQKSDSQHTGKNVCVGCGAVVGWLVNGGWLAKRPALTRAGRLEEPSRSI